MSFRTVELSDYEAYLAFEYPADATESRAADVEVRRAWMVDFPFAVMLLVSFAERDFANRWLWNQFGPAHGECIEHHSEYSACDEPSSHCHLGRWMTYWHVKTEYNFGFNEWYFAREADRDQFLEVVPHLNWGEKYPK